MTAASISKAGIRSWLRYSAPALLVLWTALAPSMGHAQSSLRDRIVEPLDNTKFSVTTGNLRSYVRPEFDQGALSPAMRLGRVTMFFSRTKEQEADLQNLLTQLQDRTSVNYHRWLSPEEFADRFGLSQADMDKIVAWLQSQGLTIQQVSRGRTWVAFGGTVQQVGSALRTELHHYAVDGETHFAISREPSVPSAFAGVVMGFRGLDDFRLKPRGVKIAPRFTSGKSNANFLTPGDLATIYNLPTSVDGTGQKIVVVGQTAVNINDIQTFRSLSRLPLNNPQVTLIPNSADPGMRVEDIDEANLDLDWAGAAAPNATIRYVYADPVNGNGVIDALFYAIDNNLAPVLSISYGACEDPTEVNGYNQSDANIVSSEAQKANSFGMTIAAASGDAGTADCDSTLPAQQHFSVDLPGALPYVTSVGGTEFNGDVSTPSVYWNDVVPFPPPGLDISPNSAKSYIPETSWNDTSALNGLAASGGGSSIYFPKPSWQTGTGVPADGARDVPDISFNGSGNHDGYLVCSEDNSSGNFLPTCANGFRLNTTTPTCPTADCLTVFGGTSAGPPIFAGIIALINQQMGSAGQGNVNPHLYAMAAASPSSFHDITTGNNSVPFQAANLPNCTPAAVTTGYLAGTGYDRVTGLGSVNATNLVNNWTSVTPPAPGANVSANFQLSMTPAALTVKRGACGSVSVVLTRPNGFVGTPVFTCSVAAPLTAVTCSVSPAASSEVPLLEKDPRIRWWPIAIVIVAICFCLIAHLHRRRSTRGEPPSRWRAWAPGFALTCLLALAIGCGGSGSSSSGSGGSSTIPTSSYVFIMNAPLNTTVGSATVTVTGTIGGVSNSAQMTLAVN